MHWIGWFKKQDKSYTPNEADTQPPAGNLSPQHIQQLFHDIHDAQVHELDAGGRKVKLFYIRSFVDQKQVESDIVLPLLHAPDEQAGQKVISEDRVDVTTLQQAEELILQGGILVFDEIGNVCAVKKQDQLGRTIDSSEQESIVYGPKDSLNERLDKNLTLIRRRLPVASLKSKKWTAGSLSKTSVVLLYMEGIVNPELVRIAEMKTNQIDFDVLLDSSHISALMEDHVNSVFPQFQQTDRPDVLAAALASGKVVWLVDNTPFALVAPITFFDLFQSPEDYIHRWMVGSFLRGLRFVAFVIALFLTPAYVAVTVHHYQMVPLEMLFVLMQSRSEIPYPPFWEALLMLLTLEILKEASLRMPTKSGQTLGVVGGIVIGQAAVDAGIASNVMVIVIAISAIASFLVPNYLMTNASKLLQFALLILAAWLGMWGIGFGLLWLCIHLHGLTSLGQPYLSPLSPFFASDWKDTVFRAPLSGMRTRPAYLKPLQRMRVTGRKP
ncbi:spore germination protein [Paenibacillus oralis]|uniref:Spore germination protein n=1 Tax=Paenibacillus oralis TaxID=2490856 RepID=A0A3P3U073_9BACL|nr:spore germination protein [Paenibacillus oralis]RRJ62958.1 spore germination protein [Paenibacillus oralis]